MDDIPPPQPDESAPSEQQLPKVPDPYTIPLNIIHKWVGLGDQQFLTIWLGKADFDNLFFAFDRSLRGQIALQRSLILLSQGKTADANAAMREAEIAVAESQNNFRQFFTAVMSSAEPVEKPVKDA